MDPLLVCMLVGALIGFMVGLQMGPDSAGGCSQPFIGAAIGAGIVLAIYITGGLLIFGILLLLLIRGGK